MEIEILSSKIEEIIEYYKVGLKINEKELMLRVTVVDGKYESCIEESEIDIYMWDKLSYQEHSMIEEELINYFN